MCVVFVLSDDLIQNETSHSNDSEGFFFLERIYMAQLTTVDLRSIAQEVRTAFEAYANAKYQYERKLVQLRAMNVPIDEFGVVTIFQPNNLNSGQIKTPDFVNVAKPSAAEQTINNVGADLSKAISS